MTHVPKTELTAKQKAFADYYLEHKCTKVKCYEHAYKPGPNVKRSSMIRNAHDVFHHPKVKAYIEKIEEEARQEIILKRSEALEILSKQARAEVARFIRKDGSLDIDAVKKHGGPAIKSIRRTVTSSETGEQVVETISLTGQREAIETLAKLENWNKEKGIELDNVTMIINTGVEEDEENTH